MVMAETDVIVNVRLEYWTVGDEVVDLWLIWFGRHNPSLIAGSNNISPS